MDYIYHYTTLPSFISMISNNQLRLMRLDNFLNLYDVSFHSSETHWKLNEKLENIYVSSWTDDSDESLSKWKLFSDLDDGIRIEVNVHNIFDDFETCIVKRVIPFSSTLFFNETIFRIKEPENKLSISKVHIIEKQNLFQITSATFEELSKLFRDGCDKFTQQFESINSLLTARTDSIASQNEIRLQLRTNVPSPPNRKRECEEYERALKEDDCINYIFVSLPDAFFKDMKILVSPNFSEVNLIMLESFLAKQGLNASAQKSIFTGSYKSYLQGQALYEWNRK